ncbi:hypothetical protein F383_38761 [Gossypium arboreum]|uniref:Uncharacterized protein n=1 Tax=Gossypium arboreum TaxID=29729 RepID=A0A0B0MMJ6_GOSAR|nr:hypothetical protein F383_38761 [Gossypium arboreum]
MVIPSRDIPYQGYPGSGISHSRDIRFGF